MRLVTGDCTEVMRTLNAGSVDAIVTDPPYELDFMGKRWDSSGVAFDPATWRLALRALKPGGHLLAFGGTRTYHRLACAIEDAGFEIRDCITWLYGSGFPKSLDVSKAIDKAAGAARERRAVPVAAPTPGMYGTYSGEVDTDVPVTAQAAAWQGWGTALKPAFEPIVVARKPLDGTVAANVLRHGTGGMNIDASRIKTADDRSRFNHARTDATSWVVQREDGLIDPGGDGRWPANVILSHDPDCVLVGQRRVRTSDPRRADGTVNGQLGQNEIYGGGTAEGMNKPFYADADGMEAVEEWDCADGCPVKMLDAQSGELAAGNHPAVRTGRPGDEKVYGTGWSGGTAGDRRPTETGGASRFFYQAKVSSAERNAGLAAFEEQETHRYGAGIGGGDNSRMVGAADRNVHPTVKPISLMRWLVRLVTPPGGVVLDPFLGSGSTGCACVLDDVEFVGIEREPEYMQIAEARIGFWQEHGDDALSIVRTREQADKERAVVAAAGQLDLFS